MVFPSSLFMFHKKEQVITGEMSQLQHYVKPYRVWTTLANGHEAIQIQSQKTGRIATFICYNVNQTEKWECFPDRNTLRIIPFLKGCKLVVFND